MSSYGLIGYPLSHSFSKKYFQEKFEREKTQADFINFEFASLKDFQKSFPKDLKGFSVTIPYKKEIIPYLNVLDDSAKIVGAVNSVKIQEGKLIGYNTDIIGFEKSLTPLLNNEHKKALVFGSGGASNAVQYVLKKLSLPFQIVSRKGKFNYEQLNAKIIQEHPLLINCSPVGMFPNTEECPNIPYEAISSKHLLYDLNYNPTETLFLKNGKKKGAAVKNGLEMLELQADASWEIWNA